MRELRFVTLTEAGGRLLLEEMAGGEQFVLSVDAPLRAAVHESASRAEREPAAAPPIGPREIQIRVRAGESPEALAAAFDMPLDRVMRFAAAAVDERRRIAGEARRARARRTATDAAEGRLVMFGEAVDERFQAHGIDPEAVRWDARRREDGEWLVIAEWVGGDASHTAEWQFSRTSRTVTPLDDTAVDLLSDRPIRPVLPPEPPRTLSMAPPLRRGVVAFPPMPDAETGPLPRVEEVFDQEASVDAPRQVPPVVPAAASLDYDAPPLPLGITDPASRPEAANGAHQVNRPAPTPDGDPAPGPGAGNGAEPVNPPAAARGADPANRPAPVRRREDGEDDRAARARIPSWDDILLGIKRRD